MLSRLPQEIERATILGNLALPPLRRHICGGSERANCGAYSTCPIGRIDDRESYAPKSDQCEKSAVDPCCYSSGPNLSTQFIQRRLNFGFYQILDLLAKIRVARNRLNLIV